MKNNGDIEVNYLKESMLYRTLRPIIKGVTVVFIRPKFIGLDNIPRDGRIILAGTHTNILDCFLLISSINRSVHFLAKNELWKGPKRLLFANMGLIPVDRSRKDPNVLLTAEKYLNNDKVIGIFPEGTTEKGRGLLPFKIGAVKMAKDTNTKIVPFVIKGKYRLFSKNLIIKFGDAYSIKNDLDKENNKLRSIIKDMLESD